MDVIITLSKSPPIACKAAMVAKYALFGRETFWGNNMVGEMTNDFVAKMVYQQYWYILIVLPPI
jgi:hypothetical protein